MRSVLRLALAVAVLAAPTAALAQVKMKRCLSPAEIQVEGMVRQGIFLREAANRCDSMVPGTAKKWKAFDQKFGARLKQQTDKRAKLFAREFKKDELKVRTYFDGRLVTYHRNVPLTTAYCTNANKQLDDVTKRGWNALAEQSKVLRDEIIMDYKSCQAGG